MAVAFKLEAEAGVSLPKDEPVVLVTEEVVLVASVTEAVGVGGVGELTTGSISAGSSSPASTR